MHNPCTPMNLVWHTTCPLVVNDSNINMKIIIDRPLNSLNESRFRENFDPCSKTIPPNIRRIKQVKISHMDVCTISADLKQQSPDYALTRIFNQKKNYVNSIKRKVVKAHRLFKGKFCHNITNIKDAHIKGDARTLTKPDARCSQMHIDKLFTFMGDVDRNKSAIVDNFNKLYGTKAKAQHAEVCYFLKNVNNIFTDVVNICNYALYIISIYPHLIDTDVFPKLDVLENWIVHDKSNKDMRIRCQGSYGYIYESSKYHVPSHFHLMWKNKRPRIQLV